MNRKIETCSLAIISKLPQICKPNEFMVAYFIINTMAIEKNDRVKMYRGELADLCNMSERNISRITESLNQSGIITKDLIGDAEKKKTYNYYRLNWQKIEEILTNLDNEDGTFLSGLSGLKKERIEESKNKRIEEIKENKKRLFKTKCEQLESSTAEDEDCDWKTELIRLESRIKRASSIDELKALSLQFNIMQNKSGIPTELEELLERVQNTAKAKVWSIKAKKCYS